jgi:hypothetical protein
MVHAVMPLPPSLPQAVDISDDAPHAAAGNRGGVDLEDSDLFHSTTSEHPTTTTSLVQLSSPGGKQGVEQTTTTIWGVAIMELASMQAFFVLGEHGESTATAWVGVASAWGGCGFCLGVGPGDFCLGVGVASAWGWGWGWLLPGGGGGCGFCLGVGAGSARVNKLTCFHAGSRSGPLSPWQPWM